MNLFIHGLDANIQLGNSYFDDKHATLKADYVLANPPFNDGSKGENGWGADRVGDKDPRLTLGGQKMALSPRNANTMWMLHFLSHLKDGGTAGLRDGDRGAVHRRDGSPGGAEGAGRAGLRGLRGPAHRTAIREHADSVLAVVSVEESPRWERLPEADGRSAFHRRAEVGDADSGVAETEAVVA